MKSICKRFLGILLLMVSLKVSAAVSSLNGRGTADNPYQISSVEELIWMRDQINNSSIYRNKHYKLMCDLDFSNESDWTPINSTPSYAFEGVFNGNNKTIRNITLDTTNNPSQMTHVGLFGYMKNGTIKDLRVEWKRLHSSSSDYFGGIVGYNQNGSVTNCCAFGNISSSYTDNLGGVVGGCNGGSVTNCGSTAHISTISNKVSGGVVGFCINGIVTNCYSTGNISDISDNAYLGGVVGYSITAYITNCYAAGDLSTISNKSYSYFGGIIGFNASGSVTNCYALNNNIQAIAPSKKEGYVFRIGHNVSGTFSDNFANKSMIVKIGTSDSDFSVIDAIGNEHGTDLTAEPVDLLNAWVANNPISGKGITHFGWKVVDEVNNGYPVFVNWEQSTDIDNLEADKSNVYSSAGAIIIENASAPIAIFNLNGILVKEITNADAYERIELSSGYYIVRIGKESHKVVVL